jgi:hypothetical protein
LTKQLGCVKKPQKSKKEIKWISLIFPIAAMGIVFLGFGGPKSAHCLRLITKKQM